MANLLIILIGSIFILFIESFLLSLNFALILFPLTISFYSNRYFYPIMASVAICSVAIDIQLGNRTGSYFLIIVMGVALYILLQKFLPFDRLLFSAPVMFVLFFFFNLTFFAWSYYSDQAAIDRIFWNNIGDIIRYSFVNIAIYLSIELGKERLNSSVGNKRINSSI